MSFGLHNRVIILGTLPNRIWSDAKFKTLAELAKRVRVHSRLIDGDENYPASFESYNVDDDGYIAFRIGGHHSPQITYRVSSAQKKAGKVSFEDVKALFNTSEFNRISKYWDKSCVYEDCERKTKNISKP